MIDFFALCAFSGLIALVFGLRWPKILPFLSEEKSRFDVFARYGGFTVGCFLMVLILAHFGFADSEMASKESYHDVAPAKREAAPPTEEELKHLADERKKTEAFVECLNLAKSQVKFPLSVDVSTLSVVKSLRENGQVFIAIPFTAENSFGQRVKMEATCHVWKGHETKITLRQL